jgi:hypothetical protein
MATTPEDYFQFGTPSTAPTQQNGPTQAQAQARQIMHKNRNWAFVVHFAKFGLAVTIIKLIPYILHFVPQLFRAAFKL